MIVKGKSGGGYWLYSDSRGILWEIKRITLPKLRGYIKYWEAETIDNKRSLKGYNLHKVINKIKEKYG